MATGITRKPKKGPAKGQIIQSLDTILSLVEKYADPKSYTSGTTKLDQYEAMIAVDLIKTLKNEVNELER